MKNEKFVEIFIAIVGVFSMVFVVVFLIRMIHANLTNIEAGMFAVVLSIFTTAAGMLLTIRVSNKTLNEELKMYGSLAMRRIIQSIKSCQALLFVLNNKRLLIKDSGFSNKEAANEFLDNLSGQTMRLISTIYDSREDWRDILKEERQEADRIDKELDEIFIKYRESQEELEKVRKLAKEAKQDKKEIEERIKKLESENKKIKEELLEKQKTIDSVRPLWPTSVTLSATETPSFCGPSSNPVLFYKTCIRCGVLYTSSYTQIDDGLCYGCKGSI